MRPVYLDNAATTPLDPRVLEAMLPYLREHYGNAASRHHLGRAAEDAVERARLQVADTIGAGGREIIWTSGATESNNLATQGVVRARGDGTWHIITQQTEHRAVLDPCEHLEQQGHRVTYLKVDNKGRIDPQDVASAIRDDTVLVSIMLANNEVGTVQPVAEVGRICKGRNLVFHTDAVQAFGKLPIDVEAMGVDLLSISGHKIYGPKGVGALYVRLRPRAHCEPLLYGGGHQDGLRPGTLNVPGIVGLGAAAEIARSEMQDESRRLAQLRDRLWNGLNDRLADITRNGGPEHCLPNILNVSFADVEGETLLMGFDTLAVSSGSACGSKLLESSYVLRALGVDDELAASSVRFSLGRFTTEADIDFAIDQVTEAVTRLRQVDTKHAGEG